MISRFLASDTDFCSHSLMQTPALVPQNDVRCTKESMSTLLLSQPHTQTWGRSLESISSLSSQCLRAWLRFRHLIYSFSHSSLLPHTPAVFKGREVGMRKRTEPRRKGVKGKTRKLWSAGRETLEWCNALFHEAVRVGSMRASGWFPPLSLTWFLTLTQNQANSVDSRSALAFDSFAPAAVSHLFVSQSEATVFPFSFSC